MAVSRWGQRPLPTWTLVVLAAITVGAVLTPTGSRRAAPEASRGSAAARLMARGTGVIAAARRARGLGFSSGDVNRTGLIGHPDSLITSSVGVLAAKRTATNPNWAAVVVALLAEAGVRPGDTVAAGFSGSFPGLNLAVMAAARSLDLHLISITAVGASNWGANDPRFTWVDIEEVLVAAEIGPHSVAASIGGIDDAGVDLPPGGADLLRSAVARAGLPLIAERSLADSVRRRIALYTHAAAGKPIAAFVNVGGAQANLGSCDEPYFVTSGLLPALPPCPPARRGVAHVFIASRIPVISLLNVRDLAIRYGLPVDPIPLPPPALRAPRPPSRTLRPLGLLLVVLLAFGVALRTVRTDHPSGPGPIARLRRAPIP